MRGHLRKANFWWDTLTRISNATLLSADEDKMVPSYFGLDHVLWTTNAECSAEEVVDF